MANVRFDEDLHASPKPQYKVKRRLLLNVVVGEGASIFELFTGEDQTLLVRRDTFFVLNLGLDVINGVGRFNLQCDRLAGKAKEARSQR